jgi:2-hydroxy-3-keto-5-methylthiopentenyl-1-phosphate phosphatase
LKEYSLKIFCDFDGTITKKDVWVDALGKFISDKGEFSKLCIDFEKGKITARDCIKKELDLIDNFDFSTFNSYIEKQELDEYFRDFIKYCRRNKHEIFILSEGLDYYIDYVLKKFGIDVKYYCNSMVIKESESEHAGHIKLSCEFPYSDENCTWCGMSKRNILINNTNDYENEISVFIGDGVSDYCVSNYADIVFAKNTLASYCWKNNITYFEYRNFNDIIIKLDKLTTGKKIKHKQNSKTLRKDILLGG